MGNLTVTARASLVALVAAFAILVGVFVVGPTATRLGAVFAAAGLGWGLFSLVRMQRIEHGDDLERPSSLRLLAEAMSGGNGLIMSGIAVYMVGVYAHAIAFPDATDGGLVEAALSAITVVGTLLFLAGGMVRVRRSEGVERQLLVEGTSIAFLVTMAASLAYATFESFTAAPLLSAWVTWGVGMVSWAIVAGVLQSRRRT